MSKVMIYDTGIGLIPFVKSIIKHKKIMIISYIWMQMFFLLGKRVKHS